MKIDGCWIFIEFEWVMQIQHENGCKEKRIIIIYRFEDKENGYSWVWFTTYCVHHWRQTIQKTLKATQKTLLSDTVVVYLNALDVSASKSKLANIIFINWKNNFYPKIFTSGWVSSDETPLCSSEWFRLAATKSVHIKTKFHFSNFSFQSKNNLMILKFY